MASDGNSGFAVNGAYLGASVGEPVVACLRAGALTYRSMSRRGELGRGLTLLLVSPVASRSGYALGLGHSVSSVARGTEGKEEREWGGSRRGGNGGSRGVRTLDVRAGTEKKEALPNWIGEISLGTGHDECEWGRGQGGVERDRENGQGGSRRRVFIPLIEAGRMWDSIVEDYETATQAQGGDDSSHQVDLATQGRFAPR